MGKVLLYAVGFALNIAVPALILRRDLKRLSGVRLERSWPDASLWSAIVMFGPLSVPIHFIRTRRSWLGLGLGLLWLTCSLALIVGPLEILARIFEIPEH